MNNKIVHPTFSELTDFFDGVLDESAVSQIENHLSSDCTSCQKDLLWLQKTLTQMHQQTGWIAPPTELLNQVKHSFPTQKNKKRPAFIHWLSQLMRTSPRFSYALAPLTLLILFSIMLYAQSEKSVALLNSSTRTTNISALAQSTHLDQQKQSAPTTQLADSPVASRNRPTASLTAVSLTPDIEAIFLASKSLEVVPPNRYHPQAQLPVVILTVPSPATDPVQTSEIATTPTPAPIIVDQSTQSEPPAALAPTPTVAPPRYTPPNSHFPSP